MSRHSIHVLGLDFTHQTPTENHIGIVHFILKVIPIRDCGRKEGRKNLRVLLYLCSGLSCLRYTPFTPWLSKNERTGQWNNHKHYHYYHHCCHYHRKCSQNCVLLRDIDVLGVHFFQPTTTHEHVCHQKFLVVITCKRVDVWSRVWY